MSHAYPLPDVARVKDIFGMLFDGLTVQPGAKLDISPKASTYCGVYVTDDGAAAAAACCDLAFAAISGAALSMLPPTAAKDAGKQKTLPPMMLANLNEVMNICTRLILREDCPHLKLQGVYPVGSIPADAAAMLGAAKRRIDLQIGITKYGSGALSVICGG
jgi:hypothetical protein